MASTILYKFRSGTTFEALPLPGSAARLFDVKKAIVKAKKLDSGSMEFDLGVRNADTNEEYADESMVLPRGTRLIVQRLPSARGHGFLARMARNEYSGAAAPNPHQQAQPVSSGSAPSGYYTIDSRARDDEDEFVQTSTTVNDEEKELAALQAVTSLRTEGPAMTGGGYTGGGRGGGPAGQGPPPGGAGRGHHPMKPTGFRPNADPELREQEKKLMPKKRATGIPRTFLNLSAPPQTEGGTEGEDGEQTVPQIQPNTLGFKELISRGGGQSENIAGTKKDLDYALKITATTIPDHLQCAICHSVVKDAMLLPWDPEGRTTCETCIRDALTQSGYRCPLTGQDGVSQEDLLPNIGLRRAADMFVKGVMDKIEEIEKQAEEMTAANEATDVTAGGKVLEPDSGETGVVMSKKSALTGRKKTESDDPFAGDDDFGGDVFAVAEPEVEKKPDEEEQVKEVEKKAPSPEKPAEETPTSVENKESENKTDSSTATEEISKAKPEPTVARNDDSRVSSDQSKEQGTPEVQSSSENQGRDRRERRRGPPVGYAMGPAGGAVGGPRASDTGPGDGSSRNSPHSRGRFEDRAPYRGGHGGRGRGRFGPRDNHGDDVSIVVSSRIVHPSKWYTQAFSSQSNLCVISEHQQSIESRGSKRRYNDYPDSRWEDEPPRQQPRYDGPPGRGRGDFRGGRGGRFGGGSGGYRGRGGYRGGRGGGRGRY